MTRLSVCIITRNEAPRIAACLASVAFADEIIVLDSGSTDATVDICRRATPYVATRAFDGFGTQKNACFARATGDWILSLDADERVSPTLADEIQRVLREGPDPRIAGFTIPRRNFIAGQWARFGGPFHNAPDRCLRLFRRGRGGCRAVPVHEGMIVDGSVGRLTHEIVHHAYDTTHDLFLAMDRYASLGALRVLERGTRLAWLSSGFHIFLRIVWTFFHKFVLRFGCASGAFGFILSASAPAYVLMKYSKLRDLMARAKAGERPEDIRAALLPTDNT